MCNITIIVSVNLRFNYVSMTITIDVSMNHAYNYVTMFLSSIKLNMAVQILKRDICRNFVHYFINILVIGSKYFN